jgi:hypothetical protein
LKKSIEGLVQNTKLLKAACEQKENNPPYLGENRTSIHSKSKNNFK